MGTEMALQHLCSSFNTPYSLTIVSAKTESTRIDTDNKLAKALQVRSSGVTGTHATVTGKRRKANYQPRLWDYQSLQCHSTEINCQDEKDAVKLKEAVNHLLYKETKLEDKLELIDALQRLGLSYQFEEEIKIILGSISIKNVSTDPNSLHATALLFRLLRENGFQISQENFNVFKDEKGCFKECLCKDAQGMLSLYEASQLMFRREATLDDARIFTTKHLNDIEAYTDMHLKERVERALELPLHWRTPRSDIRWYVEQYNSDMSIQPVLQLAKVDFNNVQILHRRELGRMVRWWEDLGLAEQLPFVRDRLVECYFYAAGVVSNPNLGYCREGVAKVCNLITTLDDVYDINGFSDELVQLTNAVNRWEISAVEGLPEYMKTSYSALYDTTNELARNILQKDGWDPSSYLKKAWADLCNSFLVEAKWHYSGYVPTIQEYLDNGWISVSGHVVLLHAFFLSRQCITKEMVQCLETYPNFVRSSSTICRLSNDLVTSAAEMERGDSPASIQCYMHEHGVTEEVALEGIKVLINETWKKLNEDVANCGVFPRSLANLAVDLAQTAYCMYRNGDGIGAPDKENKNDISSTFFKPMK
nr:terpene synthase 3 [Freesia hybrid cultivar]